MGYRNAELPDVNLDEFESIPFFERMKILMIHWVDYGFGTPKQSVTFYVWKIFFFGLFGLIFWVLSPPVWSSTTLAVGGMNRFCTKS